jgi:hypothetical protein
MQPRLLEIYDRVAEWLKFAEAKNAGLVAFNSAVVAGLVGAWDRFAFLGCAQAWVLGTAMLGLVVAALIALAAMIPQLAFIRAHVGETKQAPSTIFYAHIAGRFETPLEYLETLAKAWDEKVPTTWKEGELDLADQIIQLSRIALHKNGHFKIAAWITLFVLGGGLFAMVVWLLHRKMELSRSR